MPRDPSGPPRQVTAAFSRKVPKIGEEITEELESIPRKLFVRQYVRPKYARSNSEGVVIGELPSRPIR